MKETANNSHLPLRVVVPDFEELIPNDTLSESHQNIEFRISSDYQWKMPEYIESISRKNFTKNWPIESLETYLEEPLNFCAAMIDGGDADLMISGYNNSLDKVTQTGIRIIAMKSKSKWVYSSSLLKAPESDTYFTFADCTLIPEPSVDQLVRIAFQSVLFHKKITGIDPFLAFISFSTKGSFKHYRVDRTVEALKKFKIKYPDIRAEGELMFDDALFLGLPEEFKSELKIPMTPNVFIFPNMDGGNVALKITRTLAGFDHVGSLIHGLNYPVWILDNYTSFSDVIRLIKLLKY